MPPGKLQHAPPAYQSGNSQSTCVACCAATVGTNNATRVINQLQLSTESLKALMGQELSEEELLKASTGGMLDAE